MREGKWKLYFPPIPEAMQKKKIDSKLYQRNLTEAHRLTEEIDPSLPEREISNPQEPCLYNLEQDPGEKNDLAKEYPEKVKKMEKEWKKWFDDVMNDWHNSWSLIKKQANVKK